MRFLIKALLAATALIPIATAASAQDEPGRDGRWRGGRGGAAEAKMAARDEARGQEISRPQPQAQAQPQTPQQQRWDGNRAGPDRSARVDNGTGFQRQPRPEQRWEGRRGPDAPARVDAGADAGRPARAGQWNGGIDRRSVPLQPEANIAVNRPGGPDRYNPRADRGDRSGWAGAQPGQRGDGRFDDRRFDDRSGVRAQGRDDRRRADDRNGWNQPRRGGSIGNRGWNASGGGSRVSGDRSWNRTWRNDRRYDYSRYRTDNRSAYRLPRYYAPSGWAGGYQRFSIGVRLNTILFNDNYWIDDPYAYRLPPVDYPYRWVRYYDDALLVDVRYGQVIDVVYDIFW